MDDVETPTESMLRDDYREMTLQTRPWALEADTAAFDRAMAKIKADAWDSAHEQFCVAVASECAIDHRNPHKAVTP